MVQATLPTGAVDNGYQTAADLVYSPAHACISAPAALFEARPVRASSLMPSAAPRPCRRGGCPQLVTTRDGMCDEHRADRRRQDDQRRGSAASRGYGRKWQEARDGFLAKHPLCQCPECDEGRVRLRPAEVVDHKIPHKGDRVLFWDRDNWQAMAKECHDRKTAREDGAFGRPTAPR